MKKLLSVILGSVLMLSVINVDFVKSSAQELKQAVVSDVHELQTAIQNARNNDTIYLKGGRYIFDTTFTMENVNKNITITCVDGETAVFSTAQKLQNWQPCTVNGVSALCTCAGGKKISALFSDGVSLQSARFPETGFCYINTPDLSDTVGSGDSLGTNGIYVGDIDFNFESPEDICVSTVHWWLNELSPMASYDISTGLIKTEKYSGMSNQNGDRYFLENVKECLDKPGEWCFNSSEDKIYYIPKEGENAENLNLYASFEAQMLKINLCNGITFKNICFAETAFAYGDEQYLNTDIHIYNRTWKTASFQSAVDACGAITVTYSENIVFENCEFKNIGCTALKFFNGSKQCKAENCIFDTIGASALFIGGKYSFHETQQNNPSDYAEDITVYNNEIKNYGQKFFGASGITLAYCDTAEISHNEIHNGYYTGISVGYCWLFGENPTQYISVKDNLIYDIGQYMLSDLGGIYLLGVQEGTVVSGNVIHDVTCYDQDTGYAGNGIYLDSGCEFITVENNLVFNCDTSAYNTTLSKNNTIRNNIFALSGQSIACLGVSQYNIFTDLHSAYYNNIFLTDNSVPVLEYLQDKNHFCGNNNIIWDITNENDTYFCEGSYNSEKSLRKTVADKGYIGSAVFANPGFVDASGFDFSFIDNAYAVSHGFEAFDYDNAGTKPGSIIGFDALGGQTAYNANAEKITIQTVKLKNIEKIKACFNRFKEIIDKFILQITGLNKNATKAPVYQSFFAKQSTNQNTDALEILFNKVKTHIPTYRIDETRKPYQNNDSISAIYFSGEKYSGKDTEVFAYYGIPKNASSANPVPAVVLVHGGGLYAQADWVQYWVNKGYAAIAIDGFGQEPLPGEYKAINSNWVINPNSHITYTGFDDIDNPLDEQWFYYYISDIILANNILRNDNRIIRNQIGVAGISWGGLATGIVMGYDERFAFAIPIYGCPYASNSSCSSSSSVISKNSAQIWEASLTLSQTAMPVFLVNGNDDLFFSPDCTTTAASYLKKGNVLFLNGINHGDFRIEETVRFANEITGKGNGNIHITGLEMNGNTANISYSLPADVKSAKVTLYVKTTDFVYDNLKLTENWKKITCTSYGNVAKATIPENARYYYFEVTGNAGNIFHKNNISASTGIYKR